MCLAMSYPQGYFYQPSASLALYSCPAYNTSIISGPRTDELGRSSSGSAFSPYAGSTAFTASSAGFNSPLQYSGDPTAAFTSYVGSPYDHGTSMAGSLGYHPYASPLGSYPYGDPAYRKNATRDATATLKAWLNEHRKNPYPTKGEKIMLAIITKMTLTQVSTWFANARRRLKKENKMTWTPRNRSEDEEDEENIDLEKNDEEEPLKPDEKGELDVDTGKQSPAMDNYDRLEHENLQEKDLVSIRSDSELKETEETSDNLSKGSAPTSPPICQSGQAQEEQTVHNRHIHHHHHHHPHQATQHPQHQHHQQPRPIDLVHRRTPLHHGMVISNAASVIHSPPASASKPKLWSLAEIATSSDKSKENSDITAGTRSTTVQSMLGGLSPLSKSPAATCHLPNNTVLSRPLYYSTPFYPGYTNYGSFGHLHSHHGPNTTASDNNNAHFNGLTQTVLNRAEGMVKECKLRSQSQADLSKDAAYEIKKGMSSL